MIKGQVCRYLLLGLVLAGICAAQVPEPNAIPKPDDRYKADILLIVAHADDDTEVASYLARAVFDQHKRVAVIYGTRGDSGPNVAGMEQGWALGDVREIEGRKAMAMLGITNVWFLRGLDTPGQDVLHSLETWHHGAALEEVVRLVRLTRPEVILTWLPVYVVGENHDDHQASAVLAVEAFDLAANPLAFPEQVAAPRNHSSIQNYGEGLRPWQPKKIYFFSDATHFEFFDGRGPQYPTSDLSVAKGVPYSKLVQQVWAAYESQNDLSPQDLEHYFSEPVRFIFGKSAVKATTTGDIFEGVSSSPIPYEASRGYEPPVRNGVQLELGGPWAFYNDFWPAHNLESLQSLLKPEAGIGPGETLWVPLLISNATPQTRKVAVRSILPAGWTESHEAQSYSVEAGDTYPVQLTLTPAKDAKPEWQDLTWIAEAEGKKVGSVTLRVYVKSNGLPQ